MRGLAADDSHRCWWAMEFCCRKRIGRAELRRRDGGEGLLCRYRRESCWRGRLAIVLKAQGLGVDIWRKRPVAVKEFIVLVFGVLELFPHILRKCQRRTSLSKLSAHEPSTHEPADASENGHHSSCAWLLRLPLADDDPPFHDLSLSLKPADRIVLFYF